MTSNYRDLVLSVLAFYHPLINVVSWLPRQAPPLCISANSRSRPLSVLIHGASVPLIWELRTETMTSLGHIYLYFLSFRQFEFKHLSTFLKSNLKKTLFHKRKNYLFTVLITLPPTWPLPCLPHTWWKETPPLTIASRSNAFEYLGISKTCRYLCWMEIAHFSVRSVPLMLATVDCVHSSVFPRKRSTKALQQLL